MKDEIKTFSNQIEEALALSKDIEIETENLENIIIDGMGASSIAGDIFRNLYQGPIGVFVNRNSQLPPVANEASLLVSISYSGETEETIDTLEEALKQDLAILAITTGGRLGKICSKKDIPYCKIPAKLEPRSAIGYLSFILLGIMENSSLLPNVRKDAKNLIETLSDPEMQFEEAGKQIAKLLKNKIPLIYSPYNYSALSYRWKTQINENAKQLAFANVFPEIFHNEIEGLLLSPSSLHIILIKDPESPKKILTQMIKFKKLLEKINVSYSEIEMIGNSPLEKMFLTIHLGDWVSYYLGLLNKVDTKKVELIGWMKK
ncbi:MAG: bifunctional phosphoglucose/phosphomannose isomerase [bacterium]